MVPSYPSGTIGFVFGSKIHGFGPFLSPDDSAAAATTGTTADDDEVDVKSSSGFLGDLVYYTKEVHRASFAIPAFLKKLLK